LSEKVLLVVKEDINKTMSSIKGSCKGEKAGSFFNDENNTKYTKNSLYIRGEEHTSSVIDRFIDAFL